MQPHEALAAWTVTDPRAPSGGAPPTLRSAEDGLINRTFLVGEPATHVLQWVNPIFDPRIQVDIEALTERLTARGMVAPRLVRTREGERFLPAPSRPGAPSGGPGPANEPVEPAGVWRLLTYVPGTTVHEVGSSRRAEAAGRLVGQFHGALAHWNHRFAAPPRRIHETPQRMAELERALAASHGHPLGAEARSLGGAILRAWGRFDGALDLPERVCHGDLKISNLRFDEAGEEGVCLIDLDTVGPMALACEMGDAWRSWCNPVGESDPEGCVFDVDLFEASARGWWTSLADQGVELAAVERASLVPGIERICLELAARFCADAVRNSYFRENRERYPQAGAHNLVRARCHLTLARSARERRGRCEAILEDLVASAGAAP